MTTPDIAGLCSLLRGDLPFHEDDGAVNECAVYARLTQAADTLERQAAEIERLRVALRKIASPNQPPRAGFDYARQIARAALTGEDA